MRTSSRRLGRLRNAINALPVRTGVLREAYEWFVKFGELPEDDDHVAFEVVQQALRSGEEAPMEPETVVVERARRARAAFRANERPADRWPPSVRALLFDEALFEAEPVRGIARAVIAAEVACGGDVESEGFAARHGIPCYGSVALHASGWRTKLMVPPYADQALRLFVRIDNLRGRMPKDEQPWFAELEAALTRCRATGELPADEVLAEAVLTELELRQLRLHRAGKDVAEAMAALDRIARRRGDALVEALTKLKELAVAGLL